MYHLVDLPLVKLRSTSGWRWWLSFLILWRDSYMFPLATSKQSACTTLALINHTHNAFKTNDNFHLTWRYCRILLILSILLHYWQIFFHKIEIFLIIWGHLFSIKKQFLLERHVKCFFLFLYYFQIKELSSIATRAQFLESFCNISIKGVSTFQKSLVVVERNSALKCSHTAQTCNQKYSTEHSYHD